MRQFIPATVLLVALFVAGSTGSDQFDHECEASSIHIDCGKDLGCVDGYCNCCQTDMECQSNRLSSANEKGHFHKCHNMTEAKSMGGTTCMTECRHKDFFPANQWDIVCLCVVAICVMIAASAGIGGGGMIVPSLIFLANFDADYASPLSSVTITGGAVANFIAYCMQKHPDYPRVKKPLIEYSVSLIIMPALLAGTSVGTLLDKILPLWLITVLLFILLMALSFRTSLKAYRSYKEERSRKTGQVNIQGTNTASDGLMDHIDPVETTSLHPSETGDAPRVTFFPRLPLLLTAAAWTATAGAALLKGGKGFDSLISSVHCGNAGYWSVFCAFIVVMVLLTAAIRQRMLKEGDASPGDEDEGEDVTRTTRPDEQFSSVRWTPKNTLIFPVICFLCGICAGMLGIGGGMVVGPLLVELGLHPKVVAATSAYAVLVSASAASFQFLVMGLLYTQYSLIYLALGFLATLVGQRVMDAIIKKMDLASAIVIVIALVTILATVSLGYRSISELVVMINRHSNMGFRSLC